MENRKLISIIVPIYNIEQYLKQCLDSILSQTMTNLEIILVDDGSTDHSGEICDQYALKDSRIRVIHKANGGLVSARKAGLELSTGEYVGYVDGDDWIEPDMYERLYEGIEHDKTEFIMCSYYQEYKKSSVWIKNGIAQGKYTLKEKKQFVYPILYCDRFLNNYRTFGTIWNKLFSREKLVYAQQKVNDEIVILEDFICTCIVIMKTNALSIIDEPLYHYRQRKDSMVKQTILGNNNVTPYRIIYSQLKNECKKFSEDSVILEQCRYAVLNSLITRSMELLPDFQKNEILYPYVNVKRGNKIVLYGAGTYGQHLYNFFRRTNYCFVELWVDRKYDDLQEEGLSVENPEKLADKEFDCVVIAILSIKAYKAIYNDLIRMNIPPQKICWVDRELIESDETWKMFGMPD